MPLAPETEEIAPGILIWHFYDPAVKADLFSTALETPSGSYLIDPIPLDPSALSHLAQRREIAGVIVTNQNHERAAPKIADQFGVPIIRSADRERIAPGLRAIGIEGGPAGETAIHLEAGRGAIVMGDALINFEPHGFDFLPAKYCSDSKVMRRSLVKLLDYRFDRMLFAHGTPIVSGARERLERLLSTR